jgi:hypothetical protein
VANVRAHQIAHHIFALGEREPATLLGHTAIVLAPGFNVLSSSYLSIADLL